MTQPLWTSGADGGIDMPPDPLRWNPFPIPDAPLDFVDGMRTLVANGDVQAQAGMAALIYTANRSMTQRALVNADGEMLFVPQQGRLRITTELGCWRWRRARSRCCRAAWRFASSCPTARRAATCARTTAPQFRLPELGPIGSNGLANARDFQAPVAALRSRCRRGAK